MKFLRLTALALICSPFTFAASKEIIELQRDVALLQDKMDALQRDLDTKLGALTVLAQQTQDSSGKNATEIANVQSAISNGLGQQLAPVSGLGTKVDSMSDDVHALKDALQELSARLERMDAKITDLKNQVQIAQNPPPAPGDTGTSATDGPQHGPARHSRASGRHER